jgi:hypothetical protein
MSWSTMWLKFGQQTYPYDDNFRAVSEYAVNNDLTNIQQKKLTNKINKSK